MRNPNNERNKIMEAKVKEFYDALKIENIEANIESSQRAVKSYQATMIEGLMYLKVTRRYKENKRYAQESFSTYVQDRFGITPRTFEDHAKAVEIFRPMVLKHGIGLVSKIVSRCGKQGAVKVFKDIEKGNQDDARPISREKIEQSIEAHKQKENNPAIKTDWRTLYGQEKAAHETTKELLKSAHQTIGELNDQITRLKAARGTVGRVLRQQNHLG